MNQKDDEEPATTLKLAIDGFRRSHILDLYRWVQEKNEIELVATRAEARTTVFEYIEVFYNRQRLHSELGYRSPEHFERLHSTIP